MSRAGSGRCVFEGEVGLWSSTAVVAAGADIVG